MWAAKAGYLSRFPKYMGCGFDSLFFNIMFCFRGLYIHAFHIMCLKQNNTEVLLIHFCGLPIKIFLCGLPVKLYTDHAKILDYFGFMYSGKVRTYLLEPPEVFHGWKGPCPFLPPLLLRKVIPKCTWKAVPEDRIANLLGCTLRPPTSNSMILLYDLDMTEIRSLGENEPKAWAESVTVKIQLRSGVGED